MNGPVVTTVNGGTPMNQTTKLAASRILAQCLAAAALLMIAAVVFYVR